MKVCYPFIEYYMKDKSEKGHATSMNIIMEVVNTPYIFHLEDDWKFFNKRPYLTECLEVLYADDNIGQCLINKNYAETVEDYNSDGECYVTDTGLRYYIQNYNVESVKGSSYWPHFSLRPSLIRKNVLIPFESKPHF